MNARKVLCHFHIFKNAGTSLDGALKREFDTAFAEYDGPRANYALSAEEVRSFVEPHSTLRAFSSHQVRFPLPEIPNLQWFPLILLRHPLDRAESVYRFERQQKSNSIGAAQAKRLDFSDYVRWRLEQGRHNLLCDFQTAFLSSGPAGGPRRADLGAATARLEEAALIGSVERMDESMVCAEARLRDSFGPLDLSYRRKNVGSGRSSTLPARLDQLRSAVGDVLYTQLFERNANDFALHQRAEALLESRMSTIRDRNSLVNQFRERCAARHAEREA